MFESFLSKLKPKSLEEIARETLSKENFQRSLERQTINKTTEVKLSQRKKWEEVEEVDA